MNIEGQLPDKQPPKQIQMTMQLAIKLLRTFDSLASIFSTCWLIVGAYYVYSTYEIVTHHVLEDENYCEYTAYTFAFIVITIGFISLVLSLIAALCACFCKSDEEDWNKNSLAVNSMFKCLKLSFSQTWWNARAVVLNHVFVVI